MPTLLTHAGCVVLSILLLAWPGGPGQTQPQDLYQAHYDLGVRSYLSLRYDDALKEFQAAYAIKPVPRLLVNIGTVYRHLGQGKEALAAYETYLKGQPNPSTQESEQLERAMAEARALLTPAPAAPAGPHPERGGSVKRAAVPDFRLINTGLPETTLAIETPLFSMVGSADDDLWLAGARGTILHFDGKVWSDANRAWLPTDQFNLEFTNIWGSAPDNLWIMTGHDNSPFMLHFNGEQWFRVSNLTPRPLVGLWSAGATWAMDTSGATLRFDGTEWTFWPLEGGSTSGSISEVFARSPSDVWAVGDAGTTLHFDGKRPTAHFSGTRSDLYAVWASGPTDVWAGGRNTTLRHFDGKAWTEVRTSLSSDVKDPPEYEFRALWGSGPADVWAVGAQLAKEQLGFTVSYDGGFILHFDGKTWSRALPSVPSLLRSVWGSGPRDVWALGADNTILRFDGSIWTKIPVPAKTTGIRLRRIWGTGPRDVWAVGSAGMILHFTGETWDIKHSRPPDSLHLWRGGANDIWAVGEYVRHYDGKTWSTMPTVAPDALNAVWGLADSDEVWAVGESGSIQRYRKNAWTRITAGTSAALTGVWGSGPADIWVIGSSGTILHFDGTRWSPVQAGIGSDESVTEIGGSSARDVWIRSSKDALMRFDGTKWQRVVLPKKFSASAMLVRGPEDVWLAGKLPAGSGVPSSVIHWNGRSWQTLTTATEEIIHSLWSTKNGDVWGAGDKTTIVRYRKP